VARSADQDRREEFAQEMGFDTYAHYQTAYREHRDYLSDRGFDASVSQLQQMTQFGEEFDPTDNEMTRQELRDWFDEYVGGTEQEFYDWLHDLYINA